MRHYRENEAASAENTRKRVPCKYEIIAVGASAGGFRSLTELLACLPASFPSSLLIVQHLSPDHRSLLADLLGGRAAVRVHQASDGERIEAGTAYIAPPNQHLLAEPGNVRLMRTPEVRHHRPSIDLLFESVAANYGPRAIAVVLSGSGNDGSTGIRAIKLAGGTTITEDPAKAEFSSMPYAAIATGCVDMVLPLGKIGSTLVELCSKAND
jgi:two-component system chemotaxis response regulator CheB